MSINPRTRLPYSSSSIETTGTSLSLTGNTTGVTTHTDSANATLYVLGDTALNGVCHAKTLKSTLPAYFQSDETCKTNIEFITNPFYAMDRISGYTYDYIDSGTPSIGFKAQDVDKIFPFLVDKSSGTQYVSTTPLIAWNWEATKALRNAHCATTHTLSTRITQLEQRMDISCTRIAQLEQTNLHLLGLIRKSSHEPLTHMDQRHTHNTHSHNQHKHTKQIRHRFRNVRNVRPRFQLKNLQLRVRQVR